MKEKLNAQETKKKFVESIHTWLMNTLFSHGKEQFQKNFTIKDSSIICELPSCYFNHFEIPEGIKIEMKFTVKKS